MELKGTGFTLRKWRLTDAASLQKNADDPTVSAFLLDRFPSPYSLQDAVNFINLKIKEEPVTNFVIDIDGEVCGVIGVDMRQDIYRKTPLLGYWLTRHHRGNGIMTEATKLVIAYAFGNLDIICIQALVLNKNPASMRVLEKAGFVKQGILERSIIKNGEVFDKHVYAIYNN